MDAKGIGAVAALGEPARLALYNYVVEHGEAGRDEAAKGTGISRALAAFHLDRLVAEGLLTATYRRRGGKTGPEPDVLPSSMPGLPARSRSPSPNAATSSPPVCWRVPSRSPPEPPPPERWR